MRRRTLYLSGLVCLCALATACGKVGAPQPPIGRAPVRPNQVTALQVGSTIRVSWLAPRLDLREDVSTAVRRADVYRLRQGRNETPVAFATEFELAADLIGFVDYDGLKSQLSTGDSVAFDDPLDPKQSALLSNTRFQYAVRYIDGRGRPQLLSNIVGIEPVPGIARPPTAIAVAQAQDEVTLTWVPPTENVDGTVPAQVVGYNIYRAKPNAERLGRPLNDRIVTETRFVDRRFTYLTPYVYVVRSVSQAPDASVESSESERLAVTPRDTFAPIAPSNVTVASAGGVVSLFWPTNTEADVVGYVIQRTDGDPSDGSTWTKLTDKPINRTTFRDDKVRLGSRYAYRIVAVDRYGNESPSSAAVSETASQ